MAGRGIAAPPRTDFGKPPPGYVPGLGRGALGFTTRSDIGPSAQPGAAAGPAMAPERGAGRGAPTGPAVVPRNKEGDEVLGDKSDYSESNFDSFSGYSGSLFSDAETKYDADDAEADKTYDAIDRHMDEKRRKRREEQARLEVEEYRKKRPKIQDQFRDLKKDLGALKESDWEAIPEPKDLTRSTAKALKEKKKNTHQFTPLPDSVISSGAGLSAVSGSVTPMMPGGATPMGGTDQLSVGRARDKMLSMKLDKLADNISGQTVVDPKGMMTDLASVKVNSDDQVSDIKKARLLLKSVITTNPKHAPGWIAAARLEEETGKIVAARDVIQKGCEICPTNEDVWLEAARLNNSKNAKAILAKAVRHIPNSVKIWVQACSLEEELNSKKAVLRRALEFNPTSVRLWKAAVELETPEDARIMLGRAVELVPQSTEMWLALARLESYENARKVLNRARTVIPTDPSIWITAAKLEEAHGNLENVELIIQKAVKSLAAQQVMINRDAWLSEAESAERAASVHTCQAIVRATVAIGVEKQDQKNTWTADAENYLGRGSIETARAIFAHMLTVMPGKRSIWLKAAQLERTYGTRESLDQMLKKAVSFCPRAEVLWLMAAKEKWLAGEVSEARLTLNSAFAANPDSEEIWLAAVKLESENSEYERARLLLSKARDRAGTARVWLKSAKLERELNSRDKEKELLTKALELFPAYHKLWIMLAQWHLSAAPAPAAASASSSSAAAAATATAATSIPVKDEKGASSADREHAVKEAREVYKRGVAAAPTAVDLWLCYSALEVGEKQWAKARAILETARLHIPKSAPLWLAAIRVELQAQNPKVAAQLQAKALQECPTSGLLWAHAIAIDPRATRKARSYDALKRCNDDAHVAAAVAKLFWLDRKIKKARNWFQRAVTVDPDLGDAWAYYYKFEVEHGDTKSQEAIIKRCIEADPKHGEVWCAVSKAVHNSRLKADGILKAVAASITDIFPPF